MLLPRSLNRVYNTAGGEVLSGLLLHTKFLNTFSYKVQEEAGRQAYYVDGLEYKTYANSLQNTLYLWCPTSEKFHDWPQLVSMGLMSKWRWA